MKKEKNRRVIGYIISASLLLGITISIVLLLFSNKYVYNLSENNVRLYKDYEITELIDKIIMQVSFIESSQRGYVITGDKMFLEKLDYNESTIFSNINLLKKYLKERGLEYEALNFEECVEDKISFADRVVYIYNTKGEEAAIKVVESGVGQKKMEKILVLSNQINIKVKDSMSELVAAAENHVFNIKKWSIIGTITNVSVALIAILMLFQDIRKRNVLQQKLNDALGTAENNLQIKDQFMANMSHEIRTPMNAIVGFTHLLQKTPMDEKQSEYVQIINRAGENLLKIINDILDFSKLESGMFRIENIPFSVPSLMDSIFIMFHEKALEKNVQLKLNMDKKIPTTVSGDPTRLTQILVNLIGNALKFTEKGEVQISSKLISDDDKEVKIEFTIQDSGKGIPDDKIDNIFERFNQGNASTTREYGGTGLGLAIVKSLVEVQHGELNVKSELGEGTIFTFTLNYQKCQSFENSESLKVNSPISINIESVKILLAEDNSMNQKLATILLEGFGFEVDVADNGQIAIEMMKNCDYDLVLMDMQMPVLDGYQTVDKLRNELKSEIPVIAMTAHVLAGEKEKCISYGMNDFITKPFEEIALYNIILKHLPDGKNTLKKDNKKTKITKQQKSVNKQLIDLSYLNELSKGKKSFVIEMIDIFLEQNPIDIKTLDEAFSKSDLLVVKAIAHKMKTSISFIGLSEHIFDNLDIMEQQQDNSVDFIKEQFDNVKSVCNQAIKELITYKEEL